MRKFTNIVNLADKEFTSSNQGLLPFPTITSPLYTKYSFYFPLGVPKIEPSKYTIIFYQLIKKRSHIYYLMTIFKIII